MAVGTGAGSLPVTTTHLNMFTWGSAAAGKSLTIGSTSAGNITVVTTSTIFDKSVNFVSSGNVVLSGSSLTHAGGNAATLGIQAAGSVVISTSIVASGSGLAVSLQADSDNEGTGSIAINSGLLTNGGTVTIAAGSATINSSELVDNLTLSSGKTATLSQGLTLTNGLMLTNGTLNAGGKAITLGGDWTKASGANFIAGSSTVTFAGTGAQKMNAFGGRIQVRAD
jgi:hypothetical protein